MKKVQVKVEKSELAAAPRSEGERSEPERSGAAASSDGLPNVQYVG